ncbi:MAG: DUF2867 domain-containing protein, partial [Holophagaceae bacterium]|nr:DUF2867 domain-containing protein [Holophagaceae bacterium]
MGDPLDFWRVEPSKRPTCSACAPRWLPGQAGFRSGCARPRRRPGGATAFFEPRGVLGYAYWYAVLPLHRFVFPG